MKQLMVILAAVLCISGCTLIEDAVTEDPSKKAFVITVGVENGYAGDCPGARKDHSLMHRQRLTKCLLHWRWEYRHLSVSSTTLVTVVQLEDRLTRLRSMVMMSSSVCSIKA